MHIKITFHPKKSSIKWLAEISTDEHDIESSILIGTGWGVDPQDALRDLYTNIYSPLTPRDELKVKACKFIYDHKDDNFQNNEILIEEGTINILGTDREIIVKQDIINEKIIEDAAIVSLFDMEPI
jgi:hypothetical protein